MADLIRASFQIERVKGTFLFPAVEITQGVRVVYSPLGEAKEIPTRNYKPTMRTADEAFMVYFPQGHSLCFDVNDKEALQRYGLLADPEAVDFGELIPGSEHANVPRTPKQIVAARLAKTEVRLRATGGLSTVDTM